MFIPEEQTGKYLFSYRYIEFYGSKDKDFIKNNFEQILNTFENRCSCKESFIHFPVGDNKCLYIYQNRENKHSPYLILRDIKTGQKCYSINTDNAKYIINPNPLLKKMDLMIYYGEKIIENKGEDTIDLQNYANFIDKYPLVYEKYEKE